MKRRIINIGKALHTIDNTDDCILNFNPRKKRAKIKNILFQRKPNHFNFMEDAIIYKVVIGGAVTNPISHKRLKDAITTERRVTSVTFFVYKAFQQSEKQDSFKHTLKRPANKNGSSDNGFVEIQLENNQERYKPFLTKS